MPIKLITGPTSEPITLAEAKEHLRVSHSEEDTYLTSLIVAAREGAQQAVGRALMPQTWEVAYGQFNLAMPLPMPPIVSVTSVKYVDLSGVLQTLSPADYELNDYLEPARIVKPYLAIWPAAQQVENAVRIRYVCGYANAAAVPQEIKQWILLRIGMLYENRESVAAGLTFTDLPQVDRLLDAYRVWEK